MAQDLQGACDLLEQQPEARQDMLQHPRWHWIPFYRQLNLILGATQLTDCSIYTGVTCEWVPAVVHRGTQHLLRSAQTEAGKARGASCSVNTGHSREVSVLAQHLTDYLQSLPGGKQPLPPASGPRRVSYPEGGVCISVPVDICQRWQESSDLCKTNLSWKTERRKTAIAAGVDFLWLLILIDSFKTWRLLNASALLPILNWQFLTFFNPLGLTLFTLHLNLMASGSHGQSCLTLFAVFVMCKDSLSPTVASLPVPKAPQKDHKFWLQSELLIVATVWENTK